MSDSTPTIDQLSNSSANITTRINESQDALSPSSLYGRRASTTTGLTWGYYGGRYLSAAIASGTVALTASATNYVVAAVSGGVVSVSTATTNWNDSVNYIRLYKIVSGASTVTSYEDHRQAIGAAGSGSGGMANPMTASGDVIYGGTAGAATRLAKGADAQVLTLASGVPTWAAPSSGGMTNPMTTLGDLIAGGAAGAPGRLGVGSAGQVLTVVSGAPAWAASAGGAFTGGTLASALNEAPTVTIASASTVNIGAAAANTISVTGTTAITAFDTIAAGVIRRVVFAGALTLTYNAASLILPGAANITTAANDVAEFLSLGAGNWLCTNYKTASGAAVVGGGGGGLTGFTSALNTASPNNTVNASSLIPSGGSTDQDGVYGAKGAGAITAQVADGTTAGGNKRGAKAVDWQMSRTAVGKVAVGANSVVGGGSDNQANSSLSVVGGGSANLANGTAATVAGGSSNSANASNTFIGGGLSNTINTGAINCVITGGSSNSISFSSGATIGGGSGNIANGSNATIAGGNANSATSAGSYNTVGGGNGNTASADYATVGGGNSNTASGINSTVCGGKQATTRGIAGMEAYSAGQNAALGDAQRGRYVMRGSSSSATAITLGTGGTTATATTTPVLPNSSVYTFTALISARNNTTGDAAAYQITGAIKRGANAAATALLGTPVVTTIGADSGASSWAVAAIADTTLGALDIQCTGAASSNIKWLADVQTVELVG